MCVVCDGEPGQVSEDRSDMVSGTGACEQAGRGVLNKLKFLRTLDGKPCRMLLQ